VCLTLPTSPFHRGPLAARDVTTVIMSNPNRTASRNPIRVNWSLQARQTPLAALREKVPDSVVQETASVTVDGHLISAGLQTSIGIEVQKEGACRNTTSTTAFMPMYAHFNSKYTPMCGVLVTSSRKDGD
jgi:hypothetical protein